MLQKKIQKSGSLNTSTNRSSIYTSLDKSVLHTRLLLIVLICWSTTFHKTYEIEWKIQEPLCRKMWTLNRCNFNFRPVKNTMQNHSCVFTPKLKLTVGSWHDIKTSIIRWFIDQSVSTLHSSKKMTNFRTR